MTDKELWRRMENMATSERSLEREMSFMLLLKQAYDKDMNLIMPCVYDSMRPGVARQGYMEVMGKRMLVDIAKARDIMNNMFNKDKIAGMVFNPNDEKMVIVLKDVLLSIMPGEKPKPEFYGE